MEYVLKKSNDSDVERIINYELYNILKYANNASDNEKREIEDYVKKNVLKEIKDYQNIIIDGNIVGSILIIDDEGKISIDELFIEEKYRNKGIGRTVVKDIINNYDEVYIWVYKKNLNAIDLYEKIGFIKIDETENRVHMKWTKS